MKKRIHWIDICKAAAIFAIVLGHVLRSGALQQYVLSFHVPLFFLLSGVVFSSGDKGFFAFVKSKAKAVLIPYGIWAAISCIIYAFLGGFVADVLGVNITQGDTFIDTVVSFIYGNESVFTMVANLPLWFLPCLFAMWLMMYAPDKYIPDKYMIVFAGMCFAAGGLNVNFLHIYGLPFNIENAVFMSGFFALGMCIKRSALFFDKEKFSAVHTILAVVLILLGAVLSQMNGHIAYSWSLYGSYPIFTAAALCGCIGWVLLCRQIPSVSFIEKVGASTLAILVMHKFPILFFQTIMPFVKDRLSENNPLWGIMISIIVIFLCMTVKKLFGKRLWFMM